MYFLLCQLQRGDISLAIYVQGSFRLGTVVRPYRNQKEQDYDIDLVCELSTLKKDTTAKDVKAFVGDRLKLNETYLGMLDEEGKRCWTLLYSEQDGIGFHLDVLPAAKDGDSSSCIAITNKTYNDYTWRSSNPKGYAEWFTQKNRVAYEHVSLVQKRSIALNFRDSYASIEDVPDLLVRTPLQRVVQILKRHRDIRFGSSKESHLAPISMIITTLAAHLYNNEENVASALTNVVSGLTAHDCLLRGESIQNSGLKEKALITRKPDGSWYIGNPSNPQENFADRWADEGHARAAAFFRWVTSLREDFIDSSAKGRDELRGRLGAVFGVSSVNRLWPIKPKVTTPTPRKLKIDHAPKPWRKS